ncbi:MAG: hypothetical protein P1V18_05350 [Candidatus Gracilibacteria bacterium]|nr:hypothetical protein [Candidatus Gracilibacteria bacterium]
MKVLRILGAIILGVVVGSIVNMGLVTLSPMLIPLPDGIDSSTMEGLKAGMRLFDPQHFVMPWLAHALGTLVGAFIATQVSQNKTWWSAVGVGVLFFSGGVLMVFQLPSPVWFSAIDLLFAYFPMAYLGYRLGSKSTVYIL